MKIPITAVMFFFLFIGTRTQEKDWTVKQVTDQLQHRYEMIDDASVQFEQHVKFGYSNIEQNISGMLKM